MLHILGAYSGNWTYLGFQSYTWARIHYDDSTDTIRVFYSASYSEEDGAELGEIPGVISTQNFVSVTDPDYGAYSFFNSEGKFVRFKESTSFPYFVKEVEGETNEPPLDTGVVGGMYLGDLDGSWSTDDPFAFYSYVQVSYSPETDTIIPTYFAQKAGAGESWNLGVQGEIDGTPSGIDITKYSTYQFCEGSTLMRFKYVTYWPFFVKIPVANSFVCANIICDLAFGNPIITPNHVEVEASSSYLPVEFDLNEDFIYGFGQPFGIFDLDPGTWTIWAKDGAGCKKSINVFIPNIPGYGLRFRHSYRDLLGGISLVEIYEKNYAGAVTDVLGSQESTSITWGERGAERNRPINGSEANFSWISEINYGFVDLFTSDSEQFKIDFKKNGNLVWRGFLTPELYNEPYLDPPYEVAFTGNDRLGLLRNFPYQPEYELYPEFYTGRRSHIMVIHDCLSKLKLDFPIYVAVNLFEENQPVLTYSGNEYQETLDQIFVNTDNYRKSDGGVMNCYEVLEAQLKPYGARIYQANGAWNIVRFAETTDEYLRHRYNVNPLTYAGSEMYQPIVNVRKPSLGNTRIWIDGSQLLEIKPGYRYNDYVQDLGYVENLIIDGDLDRGTLANFSYGAPSYANPQFWLFSKIDRKNYALSWNNNFTNNGSLGGILKVKLIDRSGTLPIGIPLYSGLYKDDLILLANETNLQNNGVWKVVEDGPWIRQIYYETLNSIIPKYILPSFGGAGNMYYVVKSGNNYNVFAAPASQGVNANESYWLQNKPVEIEHAVGDKLNIIAHKKLEYQGSLDMRLRIEVKVGDLYLNDALVFSTHYNFIEYSLQNEKGFSSIDFIGTFKTAGIGDLTVKIWVISQSFTIGFGGGGGVGTNVELIFGPDFNPSPNFLLDYVKAIYLPQGFEPDLTKSEFLKNSNRFTYVPDSQQVMHGDAPGVLNKDKIYDQYLTLADGTLTQYWKRKNYYESKNLLKLLLETLMAHNLKSNHLITGTLREFLTLNNVVYDSEDPDKVFEVISYTYLDHEMKTEVELSELNIFDDSENQLAGFSRGFSRGFNA